MQFIKHFVFYLLCKFMQSINESVRYVPNTHTLSPFLFFLRFIFIDWNFLDFKTTMADVIQYIDWKYFSKPSSMECLRKSILMRLTSMKIIVDWVRLKYIEHSGCYTRSQYSLMCCMATGTEASAGASREAVTSP